MRTEATGGEQFSEKNVYQKLLILYYNRGTWEFRFSLVLNLKTLRGTWGRFGAYIFCPKYMICQIKWKEKGSSWQCQSCFMVLETSAGTGTRPVRDFSKSKLEWQFQEEETKPFREIPTQCGIFLIFYCNIIFTNFWQVILFNCLKNTWNLNRYWIVYSFNF